MASFWVSFLLLVVVYASVRCDDIDGVADETLNDDEVEAVTDFIQVLRREGDRYDLEAGTLGDSSEPLNTNSARSRQHMYAQYVYQQVPDSTASKRAGIHSSEEANAPCDDEVQHTEESDEYQHGEESHVYVGSLPGKPGVHFPNYKEIPLTSFTCAGKRTTGFYADLETDCQVFHVCYPHRRESFLCPVGTIFNQPILACDYWYNGNCSASSDYFESDDESETSDEALEEIITTIVDEIAETEAPQEESKPYEEPITEKPEIIIDEIIIPPKPVTAPPKVPVEVTTEFQPISLPKIMKFVPVKAKVTKIPVAVPKLPLKIISSPKVKVLKALPVKKVVSHKLKAKVPASVKAIPVAALVKASGKKFVLADKALTGKVKLGVPIVKSMAIKKGVKSKAVALKKAKLTKVAAVPVISIAAKKHLAAALTKMLTAQKLQMLSKAKMGYL